MRHRGIVIKRRYKGEFDHLIDIYTEQFGKITVIAKSIIKPSSKQASHIDVLNNIDFSLVPGNGYPIITSALSINNYSDIKKHLPAYLLSFFVLESIDKLVYRNDPDPVFWEHLNRSLQYLNSIAPEISRDNYREILDSLKKETLVKLGYADRSREFSSRSLSYILNEISQDKFYSLQFINSVLK